jgi:hypothetical protein
MHHPVINCPKCQGLMEEGFVLDRGHYDTRRVNTWVEGEPVKSFWSGIKVKDKQQFEVKTFRCAGCGYLESYAIRERDDNSSVFT